MPELAKAYVQIIPTTEGIQGQLTEALGGEADAAGKSAGGKFGSAFGGVAKTGLAAVGALAAGTIAAFGAMVKGAADVAAYGDNIDKMSQKMGLSTEAYQEWSAVMQHSGTSIDSMQASMKTLANAVENDNAAFSRLGLTQEYIATLSNEDLFAETITALQNVDNETERTYLAGQLLGRGATELGALLNTSAEETQAMRDRVHELGGVMSDEAVKAAAAYQDSLQDMQTAFSGVKRGLTQEFLPGITSVMDGLTEIFSGNSEDGIGMISDGVSSVVDTISSELPEFLELGSQIIVSIAEAITENLPTLLTSGADAVMTIADGLLKQLPDIVRTGLDVIVSLANGIADSLPTLVPTIVDVILEIVATLTDPQTLGNLVGAALTIIIALADGLIAALPEIVAQGPVIVSNLVTALTDNIPMLVQSSFDLIVAIVEGIVTNLPQILAAGVKIISSLVEGIVSAFDQLIQAGKDMWEKIKEGWHDKVDKAKEWGSDLIDNLKSGIEERRESLRNKVAAVGADIKSFLGFSEPEQGPLSNFHTFAPDMMALFARGIRENERMVRDQIAESFDFSDAVIGAVDAERVPAAIVRDAYRPARAAQAAGAGDADTAALADAIVRALNGCGVYMDGTTVGKIVTRAQANAARAYG